MIPGVLISIFVPDPCVARARVAWQLGPALCWRWSVMRHSHLGAIAVVAPQRSVAVDRPAGRGFAQWARRRKGSRRHATGGRGPSCSDVSIEGRSQKDGGMPARASLVAAVSQASPIRPAHIVLGALRARGWQLVRDAQAIACDLFRLSDGREGMRGLAMLARP